MVHTSVTRVISRCGREDTSRNYIWKENARAKRAKLLFFVKYTNLWFSFARCHRACLSTLLWSYGQQRSWFPEWEGASLSLDACYTEIFFFVFSPDRCMHAMDFCFYVLFSHFRLRNVLKGISLLSFPKLCVHVHAHKMTLERNYSLKCTSRGVKWENNTYKLKRSIPPRVLVGAISWEMSHLK